MVFASGPLTIFRDDWPVQLLEKASIACFMIDISSFDRSQLIVQR